MKPFIGIKRIWYGMPMTEFSIEALNTWLGNATEVKNAHEGTWAYEQDDPEITDYINELTGKPYFRDPINQGAKTINFTLGVYAFKDRVELQGGSLVDENGEVTENEDDAVAWSAPETPEIINKAIMGLTKTGNIIIFTNASIIGKVDTQEKNLGLGVQATATDTLEDNVKEEYWIDGTKYTIANNDGTAQVVSVG